MTKYITIALLAGGLFACDADTNNNNASVSVADDDAIPAGIVAAFNAAYPAATDVEWDKERKSYEVEFKINGDKKEINYDFNGKIIEIED